MLRNNFRFHKIHSWKIDLTRIQVVSNIIKSFPTIVSTLQNAISLNFASTLTKLILLKDLIWLWSKSLLVSKLHLHIEYKWSKFSLFCVHSGLLTPNSKKYLISWSTMLNLSVPTTCSIFPLLMTANFHENIHHIDSCYKNV